MEHSELKAVVEDLYRKLRVGQDDIYARRWLFSLQSRTSMDRLVNNLEEILERLPQVQPYYDTLNQRATDTMDTASKKPERPTLLSRLLELAVAEAILDRNDVNIRGNFSTEEKRAVANMATKLQEAQMWLKEAETYYNHR